MTKEPTRWPVVGIGASAGGLRALEEFFDNMPADSGATFVVIQHLSPDFKSLMKELLERRTRIAVRRVEGEMEIEQNTIYLIPPRNNLVLESGRLKLIEQNEFPRQQPNFPIDIFFSSLAKDRGNQGIGIVLSGTGSDGTKGLQHISESGGLTFVQSPSTAEFDGMPQSAIGTGLIDQVLSPADIARTIYQILQMQLSGNSPNQGLMAELPSQHVHQITEILNQYEDIDFSHYKLSTLTRRVYRRCSLSGHHKLEEYIDHLRLSAQERALLKDDLMIGVTQFFRDPEAWFHVEQTVLPQLIHSIEDGQQLRIWVTACSTGEEAYSMAILVHEVVARLGKDISVKIFATDIDSAALAKAAQGVYPQSIATDITPERLQNHFTLRDRQFSISRNIRSSIIFAPHNLAKNAGFTRMHLITCRNALIYMQPQLQQHVLRMLHFSLVPKGILFLGSAENPGDIIGEFDTIHEHSKLYRKRRHIRLTNLTQNLEYSLPVRPKPLASSTSPQRFDPIISTAFSVFAKRKDCTILYSSIPWPENDTIQSVNLEAIYHEGKVNSGSFLMLIIENEKQFPSISFDSETFQPDVESSQRILELEYELQKSRENLQATIEELETTNEEQQATNEELLASNEELQSTNEELHSVNEELYTVNTEDQLPTASKANFSPI
ncbi:chemotaxis protein CheB [Roseofilum sp. BLCC_M114]|uniref:Chemotaxis protein CheB n=1 Tax=Roseofilum capinflatum BLCC-M114 TaxID=3022440 RepID=A0ABT7B1X6_9CYAN|nr:chemotaxis protein CheB [Roseofilum capinflatum]MDJ1173172.1 chemotaxis protein CheB [Roseofilum capinflatum BLCC-M114]